MPISIKITGQETPETVEKEEVSFKLETREAINGDTMIMGHKDIDIVIKKANNKIITFAKETISDFTYGAEARLLEFMRKRGVLEFDSIQGGNIYGSLEGKLMAPSDKMGDKEVSSLVLQIIAEWMEDEKAYIQGTEAWDELEDGHLVDPDNEYSTNLGEVPAAEQKGSIIQRNLFAPYLYGRYLYE